MRKDNITSKEELLDVVNEGIIHYKDKIQRRMEKNQQQGINFQSYGDRYRLKEFEELKNILESTGDNWLDVLQEQGFTNAAEMIKKNITRRGEKGNGRK